MRLLPSVAVAPSNVILIRTLALLFNAGTVEKSNCFTMLTASTGMLKVVNVVYDPPPFDE